MNKHMFVFFAPHQFLSSILCVFCASKWLFKFDLYYIKILICKFQFSSMVHNNHHLVRSTKVTLRFLLFRHTIFVHVSMNIKSQHNWVSSEHFFGKHKNRIYSRILSTIFFRHREKPWSNANLAKIFSQFM